MGASFYKWLKGVNAKERMEFLMVGHYGDGGVRGRKWRNGIKLTKGNFRLIIIRKNTLTVRSMELCNSPTREVPCAIKTRVDINITGCMEGNNLAWAGS